MALALNEVGDVVVNDPTTMLALADAGRFALFHRLQRLGSGAIADLAGSDDESIIHQQLEVLTAAGLVERDGVTWRAVGSGILLDIRADDASQVAGRRLAAVMMLSTGDIARRWVAEHEPHLEAEWFQACGVLNASMTMTSAELVDLQARIEALIEPYLNRPAGVELDNSRRVRLLSYFLADRGEAG